MTWRGDGSASGRTQCRKTGVSLTLGGRGVSRVWGCVHVNMCAEHCKLGHASRSLV